MLLRLIARSNGGTVTPTESGAPKNDPSTGWLPPDGNGHRWIRKANLGRHSKRFLAIFSPKWTLLDVLERLWMVGRVGIEPTTN